MADDQVKLLIADTRRATQWVAALEGKGIAAQRVEARGDDAEKAEWQILVPKEQAVAARKIVSDVLAGREKLPHRLLIGRSGRLAMVGILAIVVGLALLVLLPLCAR